MTRAEAEVIALALRKGAHFAIGNDLAERFPRKIAKTTAQDVLNMLADTEHVKDMAACPDMVEA